MPTKTTLGQLCTAEYDQTGALKFKVKTSVDFVKTGDLPFEDIFVHQIVVANDPKSDKFLRVGNIVDITTLSRGRDAALTAHVANYLVADFTVQYDDVTTGTAAKLLIQARVDQLIADWIKYNAEFVSPDSIELPAVDSTVVQAAKNTYTLAKNTHVTKEAALVIANDALTDAQAAATAASLELVAANTASALCAQNLALLASGLNGVNALRSVISGLGGALASDLTFIDAAKAFKTQSDVFEASVNGGVNPTFEGQVIAFNVAISAFETTYNTFKTAVTAEAQAGQAVLAAAQAAITTECNTTQAAALAAASAKTAADAAVAAAQTTQVNAQAAADQAQTAEEAALAALLDVCPDFTV